MMSILHDIIARRREDIEAARLRIPEELLSRHARAMPRPRDFAAALRPPRPGAARPRVIAELKKASPSKGLIRADFHPVELARQLTAAGAAALSVLTEPHAFQGGLRILRLARGNTRLPLLCKDFITDPYQVYQARVFGADAILLIVACLDADAYRRLSTAAAELRMTVLTEIHTAEELDTALGWGARVIGVNSRDLKTFKTDWAGTDRLLRHVPADRLAVAESGIASPADLGRLTAAGAAAFLVGETLMRAERPGEALARLLGDGGPEGAP